MSDIVALEFRSPRSKLARARTHMATLTSALAEFEGKFTAERRIEPLEPGDGSLYERGKTIQAHHCNEIDDPIAKLFEKYKLVYAHRLYVKTVSFDDINVIAADVVQNLRQALDHSACACARAIGKTDNGTYFTLVSDPLHLEERLKDQARKLPESIKSIIRLSEPGGGLLSEMHQLALADKHRTICGVTCVSIPKLKHIRSGPSWIAAGFGSDEWDPVNQCLCYALTGSPTELDYEFEFVVQIRFNTGGVISSQPAILALDELCQTVDSIVGEMEREMTRLLCVPGAT